MRVVEFAEVKELKLLLRVSFGDVEGEDQVAAVGGLLLPELVGALVVQNQPLAGLPPSDQTPVLLRF